MCGIAGLWDRLRRRPPEGVSACVAAMTARLAHRGPDEGRIWSDAAAGLALGHRRLSIVELSPAGAQPMISSCGRFVLSYNGEIYNAVELRTELIDAGRRFRGRSDTEIIVEGAAVWGLAATVGRLIGMFAMALWDRESRALFLVRDRLGIKPLYWAEFSGSFLFGSELKALRADTSWSPELDRDALAAYLRCGYVPAPHTIYRGAQKLPAGTILTIAADGAPALTPYWSLADIARRGQEARFAGTEEDAAGALEGLLRDAVGRRMVADVPLGAFLSGGIDSSTVVALMQAQSARPVRTFSIGFREDGYDEGQNAAAVARHLGTDHTELYASPQHALDAIPRLPEMYDEPFADSSQIPTFLVSQMTRGHVTVALSGDGGDELFGGYTRYFRGRALLRAVTVAPPPLRALAAGGMRALSPAAWSALGAVIPEQLRPAQLGDKIHKLAGVLTDSAGQGDVYRRLVSLWDDPADIVRGGREPAGPLDDPRLPAVLPDPVERMQYLDMLTYLPDDILTKLDRASMAVSLEARVPLLDHRLVAFAWMLPPAMKAADGIGKRVLRRVLYRHVPRRLVDRPKMGFAMPVGDWLRRELRDWAEDLLDERELERGGIFAAAAIRRRWREHLGGSRNWQASLWAVLMFQAWRRRWLS
ncbi:MAG TPA: asparagine synthase (glutamine-hydrolyzing) [Stellaceae bacterium]|nr:asparagine synthase (glutamine-hydrolyzing) [Stellaceae bacterium]